MTIYMTTMGPAIESQLEFAYAVTHGKKAKENKIEYQKWLESLTAAPAPVPNSELTARRLAEAGHVAYATRMLKEIDPECDILRAKAIADSWRDDPDISALAVELDDIDKSYDQYDYNDRLEVGQTDFVEEIETQLKLGSENVQALDKIVQGLDGYLDLLMSVDNPELMRRIVWAKEILENLRMRYTTKNLLKARGELLKRKDC